MTHYTCDRCGCEIPEDQNRSGLQLLRGLVTFALPSPRKTLDLCGLCADSFYTWLHDLKIRGENT